MPTPSLHRPPHPTPHGAMDRARHHARQVSQGQGGQAACRLRHHVHRRRRARQGAPSARAHHPRTATRVRRALKSHRNAHARGLPPAHCLASACPPARRTSASPRSASPATWCPPSSPPPPWRSSSVSSVRSRCERSVPGENTFECSFSLRESWHRNDRNAQRATRQRGVEKRADSCVF